MGVYIKGVTMPPNCEYCPFRVEGKDVADFCGVHSLEFIWCKFDKRPDDCPLVEVEAPHGRLIDAGQAREAMMYEMCGTGYQCIAMSVLSSDFYTPTVLEAEDNGED